MTTDEAKALLERAVTDDLAAIGETAVCSALQVAVGTVEGELLVDVALGRTRLDGEGQSVDAETRFDVASLTKPLVTATLLMRAVEAGEVGWSDPIGAHLDLEFTGPEAPEVTLLQLLNHTSGLPDWVPLHQRLPALDSPADLEDVRREAIEHIASIGLEAPPGTRETYSDLGYILLAEVLERTHGSSLDELAREAIFEPLEMRHTRFAPLGSDDVPLEGAVATEEQSERGVVSGTVHDRNAAVLGGVSGHTGVFSTARDLLMFGRHLAAIDQGEDDDGAIIGRDVLTFCWSERARGGEGHHLGGWDTPSGERSSAGRGFAAGRTVGHLGFTGTSIWIERNRGLVAVLLTNRVYPSRDNDRIDDLRVAFHEAILPAP